MTVPAADPVQTLRERITRAIHRLDLPELRMVALAVEVATVNPPTDPLERKLIEHFYVGIAQCNAERRYEGGGD